MERLRKLRQNMGVTQEQLADDLSVAKSTIGMWENQKREPDLKMLEKIADFFKTSVDYLIGRVDEPHSFFRGFSTNMLPDEILECCNGDTEKALEKWNQMYDLNSVIRLDMAQYNNIRNNIQFLSYKMGETPEESIIHAGLEKDLWNVILNHYPQISILQIKALAVRT